MDLVLRHRAFFLYWWISTLGSISAIVAIILKNTMEHSGRLFVRLNNKIKMNTLTCPEHQKIAKNVQLNEASSQPSNGPQKQTPFNDSCADHPLVNLKTTSLFLMGYHQMSHPCSHRLERPTAAPRHRLLELMLSGFYMVVAGRFKPSSTSASPVFDFWQLQQAFSLAC